MHNILKSKIALFLIVFLIFFSFSCKKDDPYKNIYADDISLAEVLVKSKIVVGVNTYYAPLCFYNTKSELIGFDIDVFNEIADIMKIEVEFMPIQTNKISDLIESGTIDCIASGFSYSDERNETYELTQAHLSNAIVLVSLKAKNLKTFEDLKGKKIGGQKGSIGVTLLKENKDLIEYFHDIIDSYNNIREVLQDLKNHGIDAALADIPTIAQILQTEPNTYSIIEKAISLDSYVYAFKKGNKALKNAVEEALFNLEKKGILEKISRKWFKADTIILGK